MKGQTKASLIFVLLLILAGASTRLVPHPYNFTALSAIALFSGARFGKTAWAFLVPVIAMFLTDLVIGFHGFFLMLSVYSSFLAIVVIGIFLGGKEKAMNVVGASLASSVLFYLITNFSTWPGSPVYPQNLSGLIQSYIAGIPFFSNQVIGDLFYCTLLFGGYALAIRRFPSLASVHASK